MLTRQTSTFLAFLILVAAVANGLAAQPVHDPKADAIRRAMGRVEKSIVPVEFAIEVTHGLRSQRTTGNTVGVVASDDGVIVVNGAIFKPSAASQRGGASVSKPSALEVVLPGRHRRLKAEYIGLDEDLGLAFLRIPTMKGTGLAPLKFDLERAPAIAEEVLAVGRLPRSHDYAATFSLARVSSIQRRPIPMFGTAGDLRSMLGCPVVTLDGKAVGIVAQNNLMMSEKTGLNLLNLNLRPGNVWILPGRTFAHLVKSPPKKRAKKGWLGIEMQALTIDIVRALGIKAQGGIIVSRVFRGKGFAADKAGLREEDIITHFDGRPVKVFRDSELAVFRQMVRDAGPKSQISLKVIRERKPIDLALNLSETPKTRTEAKKFTNRQFGLVVSEITFDAALVLGMGLETMGVIVDYVERGSWVSLGGLQPNDVIQRIDNLKVTTIEGFEKKIGEIENAKRSDAIPVLVLRGNETVFTRIEPDWK